MSGTDRPARHHGALWPHPLLGHGPGMGGNGLSTRPTPVTPAVCHDHAGTTGRRTPQAQHDPLPCFVAGTLIHTAQGLLPAEGLLPGVLILTADHGFRPLRKAITRVSVGHGPAAPVLITAGSLGNSRNLYLSPRQRLLLSDWRAHVLFGTAEVLADAAHLVNGRSVRLIPCARVDYVQLVFHQPELIFAEGILTESSHAARRSPRPRATPDDLLAIVPERMPTTTPPERPDQCALTGARSCWRASENAMLRSRTSASRSPSGR
ncbi:MAG: Hint domain-containing protein [Paracoccaceae bacterium]